MIERLRRLYLSLQPVVTTLHLVAAISTQISTKPI
jgi:hypothetical protein